MDWYMVILRIVHILAGIFWVGSAVFFFAFVEPTARALGPDAQRFMQHMTVARRVPIMITASAALTLVAGVLLYWRDSDGFQLSWITSGTGLTFTAGALFAIAAFALGLVAVKPRVDRLAELGGHIQAGGGPPTVEQLGEIQHIGEALRRAGTADVLLLTIAVVAMASARYVSF